MSRYRLLRFGWWLCAAVAAGLSIYLVFLEPPLLDYPEQPFQVLTPVVQAGKSVEYVITRNMRTDRPIHIVLARKILNSQTHEKTDLLGSEMDIDPKNGKTLDGWSKVANPTVPHSMATGTYRICGTTKMPATLPFITRTVPWCTQTFKVEAAEAAP